MRIELVLEYMIPCEFIMVEYMPVDEDEYGRRCFVGRDRFVPSVCHVLLGDHANHRGSRGHLRREEDVIDIHIRGGT